MQQNVVLDWSCGIDVCLPELHALETAVPLYPEVEQISSLFAKKIKPLGGCESCDENKRRARKVRYLSRPRPTCEIDNAQVPKRESALKKSSHVNIGNISDISKVILIVLKGVA